MCVQEGGIECLEAGVKENTESPCMGAGNQALFFCKSNMSS